MGKGIHKTAVVPVESVLLALGLLLTGLRLYLRLILQRTRLTLSDYILIAACLDAMALLITDVMAYNRGGMDDYDPDAPLPSREEEIALMKINFSGNYFYDTGVYFPKLALLAFYYRLIPSTMPNLRKLLYFTTGLTIVFALTTCMVDTFWCGINVPVNWDPEGSCSTFTSMEITRIDWSMNIFSDVLIFSIPFPLLKGLQVNKRYMVGLIATFSSGIITVAASVSRFATITAIHAWTNVYVLSMAELIAAIIVVCLPGLKSLVRRNHQSSKRTGESSSRGNGFSSHGGTNSHMKLSSGRDPYSTTTRVAAGGEDSGSEVELNNMGRSDVIYKSEHVSVTYQSREV